MTVLFFLFLSSTIPLADAIAIPAAAAAPTENAPTGLWEVFLLAVLRGKPTGSPLQDPALP